MIKNSQNQQGSTHVIIVAILAIALAGALGLIFWQNFVNKETSTKKPNESVANASSETKKEDPYAGWKTYTSGKNAYSIIYPSDWIVINETNDDGPYIRNFDPLSKPSSPKQENTNYPVGYINMHVLVDQNDSNYRALYGMSPAEFYEKLGKVEVGGGAVTYSPADVKSIKIGSYDAKSAKSVFTETNEVIFILRNEKLYSISLFPYGVSSNETVKKILDSLSI